MACGLGLLLGDYLVVGVEDEPTGGIRVYLNHRPAGYYVIVTNKEDIAAARSAWANAAMGHLTLSRDSIDPSAIQQEMPKGRTL